MNKHCLRALILFLTVLFSFQTFDAPPLHSNPRTCCGRAICMCKHASGAFCPFRHQMQEQMKQEKEMAMKAHSHCSLHKNQNLAAAKKDLEGQVGFRRAPCASDTPKTIMSQYAKDFLVPVHKNHFVSIQQSIVFLLSFDASPLLMDRGIEHPPKNFLVSYLES